VRDGQTGRLVPPGEPHALAGAILESLADPARARTMARCGQALVLAHHSLDAAMARTLAVYEAVLARSPDRRRSDCVDDRHAGDGTVNAGAGPS
jgi:glycosyltransferase involved in cell wall biosynthesis